MAGWQSDLDDTMGQLEKEIPPGLDKLLKECQNRLASFERVDRLSHYVEGMKVGVKLIAYLLLS